MSQLSVMLVDDDHLILDGLVMFLKDEGFKVSPFTSVDAALAALADNKFDICITDLRMPGMNGEKFVLVACKVSPQTRFMIHTGSDYTVPGELTAIGLTQANVLQKPVFDLESLTKRIVSIAGGNE